MTTALADVTAFVLLMAITAYSVAGGVDYGAGIWDMLAGRGPTAERARQLIDHAMAALSNRCQQCFLAFESARPIPAIRQGRLKCGSG